MDSYVRTFWVVVVHSFCSSYGCISLLLAYLHCGYLTLFTAFETTLETTPASGSGNFGTDLGNGTVGRVDAEGVSLSWPSPISVGELGRRCLEGMNPVLNLYV